MVDDPFDFGRIAAANALSDIYAMGARPLFALGLIAFPRALLEGDVLAEIVRGASAMAAEAGIPIVGGHSVDDPEPKYGMCVIGEVHPDRIVRNNTARAGDAIVLTKPIGTGVIATAIKAGAASDAVIDEAVRSMTQLNRAASAAMLTCDVSAATDVTGFGLLGHLRSVVAQSGVSARVRSDAVPLLSGAAELVERGFVPAGTGRNQADGSAVIEFDAAVSDVQRTLLFDAQTSGGLLICVSQDDVGRLIAALHAAGCTAACVIGEITADDAGMIRVTA
jgi:selenide,water dikinase